MIFVAFMLKQGRGLRPAMMSNGNLASLNRSTPDLLNVLYLACITG